MPVYTTEELLNWIYERNRSIYVSIRRIDLKECAPWFYDEASGEIVNENRSFFRIAGIQSSGKTGTVEQPIIIQDEIGYLGIICHRFHGEMHYLMQAKIEPGNVNKIQLSPTIQATKSNFTQRHGGKKPPYLEYFTNALKHRIIVDQIQSEQSSRFYKKRNRNIIIEVQEDVPALPSHRWMTLKQIKELMRYDNLVNMDTRTVLSCLPLWEEEYSSQITDCAFARSVVNRESGTQIYQYINDYKMFDERTCQFVPLFSLERWEKKDGMFICKEPYSFRLIFCDIEIEGREVCHWSQPLFEATGMATFGLITRVKNGVREFLVRAKPEIGCFDRIELGPSVQREFVCNEASTAVDLLFDAQLREGRGILFDTILSEEGGRFYQEQNRNVVLEIEDYTLADLPSGYFWTSYHLLNSLVQINNCLNIQLRNLLSVMEW